MRIIKVTTLTAERRIFSGTISGFPLLKSSYDNNCRFGQSRIGDNGSQRDSIEHRSRSPCDCISKHKYNREHRSMRW
jgi:hypothetical protein